MNCGGRVFHDDARVVELSARELPAFYPNASMPLWAPHPRIFMDVVNESEAMCPYCGTRYRLKRDAHFRDHGFGTRDRHQHHEQHAAQARTEPWGSTAPLQLMTKWLQRCRCVQRVF